MPEKGRANIQVLVDYGLATSASDEAVTDADMIRFSETCLVFSYITQEATTKTLTQQDLNTVNPAPGKRGRGKTAMNESNITDTRAPLKFKYNISSCPIRTFCSNVSMRLSLHNSAI